MQNQILKRKRRNRQEWQQIVDTWATSGQSVPVFCKDNNLSYASFSQWRRRLENHSLPEVADNHFFDLSSLSRKSDAHWHITLKLGSGVELVLSQQ